MRMSEHEEVLGDGVWAALARRGVSRRDFLKFCSVVTASLALPPRYTSRVVQALEQTHRPALVWLEFQDCAGNSESALRASHPSFADIVLDLLSWNYHETVMAPSGAAAEKSLHDTVTNEAGTYLAVVEGSIPLAENGVYCTVGGRTALDIAREVCTNAYATIAVGTCAAFGGIPAAGGGVTGAVGVDQAIPGLRLINLSACPMNGANLAATIVHWLTFKELRRPTSSSAHSSRMAIASTTTVHGGRTTTPDSSSRSGVTKAIALAGVSIKWAAKVRQPATTARRSNGMTAPTGRSAWGMAASAVRSQLSGM
jgi:NiFe hydrogenase small subunit HydA